MLGWIGLGMCIFVYDTIVCLSIEIALYIHIYIAHTNKYRRVSEKSSYLGMYVSVFHIGHR